jgi:hypothetical protein
MKFIRNQSVDCWWFRVLGRCRYSTWTEDSVLRKRETGTNLFKENTNWVQKIEMDKRCYDDTRVLRRHTSCRRLRVRLVRLALALWYFSPGAIAIVYRDLRLRIIIA